MVFYRSVILVMYLYIQGNVMTVIATAVPEKCNEFIVTYISVSIPLRNGVDV